MKSGQLSQDQENIITCKRGKQSKSVCLRQECQHQAFICDAQDCECHLPHNSCLEMPIKRFEKNIISGAYSLKSIENKIDQAFEQAIDQLSAEREKVMIEIKDNYRYLGLSQPQKKFLDVLKKASKNNEITCKFVWDLYLGLRKPTDTERNNVELEQQISKIQGNFNQQITSFSKNLTNLLQKTKEKVEQMLLKCQYERQQHILSMKLYQQSKIVNKIQDQNKLFAFFTDRKVKGAVLLYRASENDFLVSKFHQKCDHIPFTLILCKTEFDKVIGGFTTFTWYRSKSGHYVSAQNNSNNHFLFSLTNNDKFIITENAQNCICLSSNDSYGPIFGGGSDLVISNKANTNNKSYGRINDTYMNANYKKQDIASYQKFSGSSSQYFTVKEWEVWQVKFQQ